MKVLYVCADRGIPVNGTKGASIHVRQTVSALRERGVEVEMIAARPAKGKKPRRLPGAIGGELDRLAESRDLALSMDLESLREIDVIYERYSLWSLTGATLAEALGVPLVVEVNAPLVEEQSRYRQLVLGGIAEEVERVVLGRADAVLCVSSPLVERAARLRGTENGVHLLPNAVDTERFRPARLAEGQEQGSRREVTIAFVGSLKPWHGVEALIHAFGELRPACPHARLMLIGEGPERERLEALVASKGLTSSVQFTGAVDHDQVPVLLQQADIGTAPYPDLENFYFSPLKLGEYLAAGLAVVASRCGDYANLLTDEQDALLVPPGDVSALANALRRLVEQKELRTRLADRGHRLALDQLSLEALALRVHNLLQELAANGGESQKVEAS